MNHSKSSINKLRSVPSWSMCPLWLDKALFTVIPRVIPGLNIVIGWFNWVIAAVTLGDFGPEFRTPVDVSQGAIQDHSFRLMFSLSLSLNCQLSSRTAQNCTQSVGAFSVYVCSVSWLMIGPKADGLHTSKLIWESCQRRQRDRKGPKCFQTVIFNLSRIKKRREEWETQTQRQRRREEGGRGMEIVGGVLGIDCPF